MVDSYRESYPSMIPLRAFELPGKPIEGAQIFSDQAHNPYGYEGDEQPQGSILSRNVL